MKASPVICVGGENLIDHVTRDGEVSALPGGSPFNVAMALGRQDADVYYVTPVSTDSWGDMLADTLMASGVTLSGGRVGAPSTIARVTVTDGIPSYVFERDGTAVTVGDRRVAGGSNACGYGCPAHRVASPYRRCQKTPPPGNRPAHPRMPPEHWCRWTRTCACPSSPTAKATAPGFSRMMQTAHVLKLSERSDLQGLCPDMSQADALDLVRAPKFGQPLLVLTKGPRRRVGLGRRRHQRRHSGAETGSRTRGYRGCR